MANSNQIEDVKKSKESNFILLTLIISIIYVVGGKLSFYFALGDSIVTITIFFPEGAALALTLIYGKKVIPGIFIGQMILALLTNVSFLPALSIATINALEALLALYLAEKLNFDKRILRLKDIYTLFFMIIFILQPFSALGGTLTLYSFSMINSSFTNTLFSWWFGNSMGQLLLVPMILVLYENRYKIVATNIILVIILFAFINYLLIVTLHIDNIALLFSIMIPLIMITSKYMGLQYAGLAIWAITISSLYLSRVGLGIFTTDTVVNNLININFYILAHIVIVYIHGTLIIEKEAVSKKLATLNQKLEERVAQEVEKNREKERFLMYQSRLAQIGEMIALVAHQWKQPLNTLSIINSKIFRLYTRDKLSSEEMETFNKNSKLQIKEMSDTIDTFRNFFKSQDEELEFQLHESIEYVLNILSQALEEASVDVEFLYDKNITLKGHQNEFGQVVLNILNNARDAFKVNNIKTDRKIWIRLSEHNEQIDIEIEDNAGGIPAKYIEKIFEPYFSTKSNMQGTGLGLYISKIIIEKHMFGAINVSNTSFGAKFNIKIPHKI